MTERYWICIHIFFLKKKTPFILEIAYRYRYKKLDIDIGYRYNSRSRYRYKNVEPQT